jgi:putative thioredoxin
MVDVTDDTFEEAVLKRSFEVPVVVDLWAPWCGPCKTLGPILEQVIRATEGSVELAKINVDENPTVSSRFKVQSIPAVFAVRDGAVVDQFIGAQPEAEIRAFIERLVPMRSEADLLAAAGADAGAVEPLRRALQLEPDHPVAVPALAALLIASGDSEEATTLLRRVPETMETRRLLAEARLAQREDVGGADVSVLLDGLLERVKADPDARQEFLDLLETLGPDDPRTLGYRKALSSRLF